MLAGNPDVLLFTEVCSPGFGRYAGTYRIASELRDYGFVVQVVEYFTKWSTEELKTILRKFVGKNTLWVGVSSTFLSPTKIWNRVDDQRCLKSLCWKDVAQTELVEKKEFTDMVSRTVRFLFGLDCSISNNVHFKV